jgi:hypothetical protein
MKYLCLSSVPGGSWRVIFADMTLPSCAEQAHPEKGAWAWDDVHVLVPRAGETGHGG